MTTEGSDESKTKHADEQLNILEKRVIYIRRMQVFGVMSFIFNLMTIILVYLKYYILANYIFGFGLLMLSGQRASEDQNQKCSWQEYSILSKPK